MARPNNADKRMADIYPETDRFVIQIVLVIQIHAPPSHSTVG